MTFNIKHLLWLTAICAIVVVCVKHKFEPKVYTDLNGNEFEDPGRSVRVWQSTTDGTWLPCDPAPRFEVGDIVSPWAPGIINRDETYLITGYCGYDRRYGYLLRGRTISPITTMPRELGYECQLWDFTFQDLLRLVYG